MDISKYLSKYTKLARKALPLRRCGAVIVAAGSASRMGGIDKVMAPLKGEPMIVHTVRAFQNCDAIAEIVIVTRQDLIRRIADLCAGFAKVQAVVGEPMIVHTVRAFQNCDAIAEIVIVTRQDLIRRIADLCAGFAKVQAVVVGGSDRQESVELGLNALSEDVELAAIQDGARPLVTWQVIDRVVRAANSYGAAVPVIPVKDTIKVPVIPVKDTIKVAPAGTVESTPDRSTLRAVQTPQVFDFDLLRGALQKSREDGAQITDDCSAVERLGMRVKTVEGDERNLKVTTFDLLRGALQKSREDGAQITDDCSAVERLGMRVKTVEGDERNLKVTTPFDLKVAEMLMEEQI